MANFTLHDNSRRFSDEEHAVFGASNYHWINYSIDKMLQIQVGLEAKKKGTELHKLAYGLIKNRIVLPDTEQTFNRYVNDSILFDMTPEAKLYFSKLFFGTSDALSYDEENGVLRIFDLKTGMTKASMHQLEVYASFFCLEYGFVPGDFNDIELRIYQNNSVLISHPNSEILVPIIDKIVTFDRIYQKMEGNNYE